MAQFPIGASNYVYFETKQGESRIGRESPSYDYAVKFLETVYKSESEQFQAKHLNENWKNMRDADTLQQGLERGLKEMMEEDHVDPRHQKFYKFRHVDPRPGF